MKRVLFCVLNWGLGHASRSLPLIDEFIKQGCDVQIACDGLAAIFLAKAYPELRHHKLPGYNVRYISSSMYINAILSTPAVNKAINGEHKIVHQIVTQWQPQLIVSDNRYGCHHPHVHSVLISHQLRLPASNQLAQFAANVALDRKLQPFSELWVPDLPRPDGITGRMTDLVDKRIKYIGFLSAMKIENKKVDKKNLLLLLSGPEPARSKFEKRLLDLNLQLKYNVTLIRGTNILQLEKIEQVNTVNLANSAQVNEVILNTNYIICRSGYSTIMDLIALGKAALYVPTPGQPEQQLLSQAMSARQWGVELQERSLSLSSVERGFQQVEKLTVSGSAQKDLYKTVITEALSIN